MPSEPFASATVVVLRDSPRGPEVLMVRRHERSGDFPAASVFPGGVVEAEDAEPALAPAETGFDPTGAITALGESISEDAARALYVAACRELFEEAGILIAREPGSRTFVDARSDRLAALRLELLAGARGFRSALAAEGCVLALDRLVPLARWITPEMQQRRWDARFFLVEAPAGQHASCDGTETCEALWLTPTDMLSAYFAGEHLLAPPTFRVLEELQPFATVAQAIETTSRAAPPRPILPVALTSTAELTMVYPGDREYPGSQGNGLNRLMLRNGRWLSLREA